MIVITHHHADYSTININGSVFEVAIALARALERELTINNN